MNPSSTGALNFNPSAGQVPRARQDDWSEVEALLEGPSMAPPAPAAARRSRNFRAEAAAAPALRGGRLAAARSARLGRVALGTAAILALGAGGLAALSLAPSFKCRGDACLASLAQHEAPSDRLPPATADGTPVRVVSIDAGRSPSGEPESWEGRSVAAPPSARRNATRRRAVRAPVPLAPIRAEAKRSRAEHSAFVARRMTRLDDVYIAPPVAEHSRTPKSARVMPRAVETATFAARPPTHARPRAVASAPRLHRVWISQNEWILVR